MLPWMSTYKETFESGGLGALRDARATPVWKGWAKESTRVAWTRGSCHGSKEISESGLSWVEQSQEVK